MANEIKTQLLRRRSAPAGLITTKEAAERLGCSVRTVQAAIRDGRLEHHERAPGTRAYFLDASMVKRLCVVAAGSP